MIIEHSYISGGEYGGGAVDDYNGNLKIVSAWENRTGDIITEWAYPQKNRKPMEKAVPVGVDLGKDRAKAAATLRIWADILEKGESKESGGIPPEHKTEGQSDYGDHIPF